MKRINKTCKFITDDTKISADDSDRGNSDEENYDKKHSGK